MTFSQKIALETSSLKDLNEEQIFFILTVCRDNTTDDYVYEVLNNIIKNV